MPGPPQALVPLGWDDRVAALFNEFATADTVPGRVVRVERTSCIVAVAQGDLVATAASLPGVGDWVCVRPAADHAVVVTAVPRWSELNRVDPSGDRIQVLAANVDLVLITAPADRLSPGRVDREVAVAWDSGARPVVVLTKADLAGPGQGEELSRRLLGVDLVMTSAVTGEGVDEVAALLRPNRTAVLLGPSGAGKSTLANALLGEDRFTTNEVRTTDHRGRHTTSVRQLVAVPTGGVLIDTPGLRSLSLSGVGDGLASTFADIEDLASGCRFGDCRHDGEPGCAVTAAAAAGDLELARLNSYRKLHRELAVEARRHDPIARREIVRMWKLRTKANRRRGKRDRER